ncbi:MAG: hypothetical protein R3E68_06535 [Burkholderiaceae bacterium]
MTSPASLQRPVPSSSDGLRVLLRRLLPLLLVLTTVLMLLWVALDRDLGSAQAAVPDGDAMLVLLIATAVSGAGLGALGMLLLVRRLARRMPSLLGVGAARAGAALPRSLATPGAVAARECRAGGRSALAPGPAWPLR